MTTLMPRKWHGGKTSRDSPKRETEGNHIKSKLEGSMGDNHVRTMLQILQDLVKGQDEASQIQVEITRF
jgi:hypothetical protein